MTKKIYNPYAGNPFHALQPRGREELHSQLNHGWEHARVEFTMNRLGLAARRRALAQANEETEGVAALTFMTFNATFSDFPMTLGCHRLGHLEKPLHLLPQAILPQWFRNFAHLPFIKPYEELYNRLGKVAHIKPVGMIFPRRGFKEGLILHNGHPDDFVPPKTSCHLYLGGGKRPMTLVVQPYIGFLDHIYRHGRGWKPEA